MNRNFVLIKNTIIFAIGNFGSKFLGLFLLPIYTSYLSNSNYGYFDLIMTTLTLFLPIVSFQIFDGVYRYLLDTQKTKQIRQLISNSLFIIFFNLILFNLIFILISFYIDIVHGYLIQVLFTVSTLLELFKQIARGLKKNVIYSMAGIILTVIIGLFSIIFLKFYNLGIEGLLLANTIGTSLAMLFIIFKLNIFQYISFNLSELKKSIIYKLIMYSIPLIPNLISWWIMNLSDRYMLIHFMGLDANGIYAVANKFASILLMGFTVFNLAWQESAISEFNSKDRNHFYSSIFNKLVRFIFSILFILLAFSKSVLKIMVNQNFFNAWMYLPFLYIAIIFSAFSSFYGTGFQSSKETKGALYSSLVGSVLNIIINLILIPRVGIQGAAISTMISFFAMWIIRVFQTKKYFEIEVNKSQFGILCLTLAIFVALYFINITFIDFVLCFLSIAIFIYLNWTYILLFKNKAISIKRSLFVEKK